MKYLLCVGDGMADFPLPELGDRTPLACANTPNMDAIAAEGIVGRVQTVPDGMHPGSDVANMALMGYDPRRYYAGRAPLEAASMGVTLNAGDCAFRCNLVSLRDGLMHDYSSGHIETPDAAALIDDLAQAIGNDTVRFHPGVSYRHLCLIAGFPCESLECTPPHDITGQEWARFLPRGPGADRIIAVMDRARTVLRDAPTNARRRVAGKTPATDIWLWGQGGTVALPSMTERFDIRGSVISAVDLVRGIGVCAGLTVRKVPGATGYLGTNYQGKVDAAREALRTEDFVFLHVEAPDETSHEGSLPKKLQAIEEFDRHIVGPMRALAAEYDAARIMVLPDHATPIAMKTHHATPVPFAVCGAGIAPDAARTYSERSAEQARLFTAEALFETFVSGTF